ncbi:hypothetical protein Pla110_40870 [Polystyrenella longa]|uniref:Glycosyl hydrolase-like 10 domain-containing protein n=1 Tax=Polystyrenella longa TaxID=2528007 RepID=A0A518CSX9_9PLAN|nr:hypothetical protein [Polystyrenella longa]QDU82332.1 hypothetical protein Pla110_40870 [Polystyrenella longa]
MASFQLLITCLFSITLLTSQLTAEENARPSRFIYNSDANHVYHYIKPPMTVENLQGYVDEVVGTGVTTFFASPNWGMPMAYPSEVTDMIGSTLSEEEFEEYRKIGADKKVSAERAFTNYYSIYNKGIDPFGVMIDRAKEQGLEVFISYRPNEIHDVQNPDSLIVSKFWRDHPEWRVGKIGDEISPLFAEIIGGRKDHPVHPLVASWFPGALNFAIPEVRTQRLAEMRECCERYPIEGLDIDLQRFPIYFPQDEGPEHVATMTNWIREVRAMTEEVGHKRGRPILLSARIMARPQQNLSIGLDPVTWAKEGLIDFVEVSHYLRNDFPLPVNEYRELMPADFPIYASIEVEKDPDNYRRIARHLYDEGADGLMIFNYFTSREGGREPDFTLFKELSDPTKLKPVEP